MNRTEFILVTALILLLAFALGWAAHWLVARFTRVSQDDLSELDRLAQALHQAEETRDQAIAWIEHREAEFAQQKAQTEAELRAAMDGLREARREVEYLNSLLAQHGHSRD
ncbi:MAG: hypothetical protein JJT95_01290 [Pararhodobacter sp.]|nr:hypothetical protein [Pararhodobacter sp.]